MRLSDLWTNRNTKNYELDDILLLKIGRHLRPRPNFKLIIGREEGENNFLNGYRRDFTHLIAVSHVGPLALVDGTANDADLDFAARLLARFGQGRDADKVTVEIHVRGSETRTLDVVPLHPDEIPQSWYL